MTKEQLMDHVWVKRNVQALEDRLAELEAQAYRTTSRISAEPRGTRIEYGYAAVVSKIIETKDLINLKLQTMYSLEKAIEREISRLPSREELLIRKRYIEDKDWKTIAVEMNYSEQRIYELHGLALKMLKEQSKSEYLFC